MNINITTIILLCTITFLIVLLSFSLYYLYKFAKIIMIFEDDLSDAIEELNNVEDTIKNVIEMPLFFDSLEVKQETQKIIEQVQYCRMSIQKLIERFTERSERKYITTWDNDDDDTVVDNNNQQQFIMPTLPGQPPGTPNPLELIYNHNLYNNQEGTVFNVGRSKRK